MIMLLEEALGWNGITGNRYRMSISWKISVMPKPEVRSDVDPGTLLSSFATGSVLLPQLQRVKNGQVKKSLRTLASDPQTGPGGGGARDTI